QSASPVIALNVKLWLTQDADIDARGTLPGRLLFMVIIPAQDVVDIEFFLLIEALGRGLNVRLVLLADLRIETTQDNVVELEEGSRMAQREQIDPLSHCPIDEDVAGQHVVEHGISHGVTPRL